MENIVGGKYPRNEAEDKLRACIEKVLGTPVLKKANSFVSTLHVKTIPIQLYINFPIVVLLTTVPPFLLWN